MNLIEPTANMIQENEAELPLSLYLRGYLDAILEGDGSEYFGSMEYMWQIMFDRKNYVFIDGDTCNNCVVKMQESMTEIIKLKLEYIELTSLVYDFNNFVLSFEELLKEKELYEYIDKLKAPVNLISMSFKKTLKELQVNRYEA